MANSKGLFITKDYYDVIDSLARRGRRSKAEQMRIIIDAYLTANPDIYADEQDSEE